MTTNHGYLGSLSSRTLLLAAVVLMTATCVSAAAPPLGQPAVSWKHLSYESLHELHEAGIASIEVSLGDLMKLPQPERPEKCRQIVADAQRAEITLWSAHIPFGKTWDISQPDPAAREEIMANVREAMEVCAWLKVQKAVLHPSFEPIPDAQRAAQLAAAKESLRTLTPEFAQRGIQLVIENLPRTCLGNTSHEILALLEGIDGLGVCFDTNHLLQEKPEDFLAKVGPHIVTLHVSDYDGIDERHWMAGEGILPWPAIAAGLRKVHYQGPFLFETRKHKDGTPVKPAEYVEFWKQL